MDSIRGIITSLPTPFSEDYSVDEDALLREVNYQLSAGVHGLCILGGTGEFFSLRRDERQRVLEVVAKAMDSPRTLVVGDFCVEDGEFLEFAECAKELGASAVMLTAPPFYNATASQVKRMIERRVSRCNVPLVLFNTPGRSGVRLTGEQILDIVNCVPSVVAVKDSSGDILALSGLRLGIGERCAILQGDDELLLPTLAIGGAGGILAMASVFPELFVEMFREWENRNLERCRELQLCILPIMRIVNSEPIPVMVKEAMELVGHPMGPVRPPLCSADSERQRLLKEEIEKVKYLRKNLKGNA